MTAVLPSVLSQSSALEIELSDEEVAKLEAPYTPRTIHGFKNPPPREMGGYLKGNVSETFFSVGRIPRATCLDLLDGHAQRLADAADAAGVVGDRGDEEP